MTNNIPVYSVELSQYHIDSEPNHRVVGRIVDDFLRTVFADHTIVVRGIDSSAHPDKTVDQLVDIITSTGSDRYDPERHGDRYDNEDGKHIDFFAFRRKITQRSELFRNISWGFYRGAKAVHGKPSRIDILIVYDSSKVTAVRHRYTGREDYKRDGFVFKNPAAKATAVLAVIKLTR